MSKRAIALGLAVITVVAVLLITYFILQREEPRLTIEQAKEQNRAMSAGAALSEALDRCLKLAE